MKFQQFIIACLTALILLSCSKQEQEQSEFFDDPITTVEAKPNTSTHVFKAKFTGVDYYTCGAYGATCPKCFASGEFAYFEVIDYIQFFANSEGGKDKMEKYQIKLTDYARNEKSEGYVKYIRGLKKGDIVTIHTEYVYDRSTKEFIKNITRK